MYFITDRYAGDTLDEHHSNSSRDNTAVAAVVPELGNSLWKWELAIIDRNRYNTRQQSGLFCDRVTHRNWVMVNGPTPISNSKMAVWIPFL